MNTNKLAGIALLTAITFSLSVALAPMANAKTCGTTHSAHHSVYTGKTTYRWHSSCSRQKGQIQMELYLCDNCDTLASVEVIGDELKIAQCNCVRTKGI